MRDFLYFILDGKGICFKHATYQAVMKQQDIEHEIREDEFHYDIECHFCKEEKKTI